jgi:hypothetical protein
MIAEIRFGPGYLFQEYLNEILQYSILSWSHPRPVHYHSRLTPKGVAEATQIFLRDTHIFPKWLSQEKQQIW